MLINKAPSAALLVSLLVATGRVAVRFKLGGNTVTEVEGAKDAALIRQAWDELSDQLIVTAPAGVFGPSVLPRPRLLELFCDHR